MILLYQTCEKKRGDNVPSFRFMDIEKRAREIAEEYLPDDHFIVELSFKEHQGASRLSIILDGDEGVSIDTCALISRKVGYFLEEEEVVDDKYNLQVSSPGADSPFINIRQYYKNIGRDVQILDPEGNKLEGTLEDVVEEKQIVFRKLLKPADKGRKAKYDKETTTINIDEIMKINVILTF